MAAVLGAGLGLGLPPREAHARELDGVAVVVAIAAGLVIADLTFTTYDLVVAGQGELPSKGWAIAETAFTVPQTLILNPLFAGLEASEKDSPALLFLMVPTMGVSVLTTHGIWSLTSSSVHPGTLAGVSGFIGANATMTIGAVSMAWNGRLSNRWVGVAQIVCTLPQVILGGYEIGTRAPDRAGWIGLTAWSGTLLLHGIASAIWGGRRSHGDDTPPLPPLPPADPPPEGDPEKPPLLVPASIHFAPTMLSNGIARTPGLVVGGVF
jgi:hypothetical protein